jgi:hypothetical protein
MEPFFKQIGIRDDLIIKEHDHYRIASAIGMNVWTKSAMITIASKFYQIDEEACRFVLKREIGHIKMHHYLLTYLIPCIYSLSAALLFNDWRASIAIGLISSLGSTVEQEWRADNFAIATSSIEELKGGRRYLLSLMQINRLGQWMMNQFYAHRLKKIEAELNKRQVKLRQAMEERKIALLKDLWEKVVLNQ